MKVGGGEREEGKRVRGKSTGTYVRVRGGKQGETGISKPVPWEAEEGGCLLMKWTWVAQGRGWKPCLRNAT